MEKSSHLILLKKTTDKIALKSDPQMEDKKNIPIPVSLQDGTVLRGELESIQPVATGGMSVVFKARQTTLNRYVAIKSLKAHLLENSETRERFRREAKRSEEHTSELQSLSAI